MAASFLIALILSTSAFAQDTTKVDTIFAAYDKPDSPGCALGVIKDGKLTVTDRNEQKLALTPTFRDAFTGRFQSEFSRDAQGRLNGFVIHAGRIRNVKFVRR